MLNKYICKKCINEDGSGIIEWNDCQWCVSSGSHSLSDESHWGKGIVWCIVLNKPIRITGDPPIECLYLLEQVIADDLSTL